MLAHDRPGRARVVEVDMGEEQMPDLPQLAAPRSRSPSSSRGSVDAGPQSKSAGPSLVSSRYTPIARSNPRNSRSIGSH